MPVRVKGAAMVVGWFDAVTDTTIWGRVAAERAPGPAAQRADLDAAADPGSTAGLLEWLAAQDAG
jgi:hypothetical protein